MSASVRALLPASVDVLRDNLVELVNVCPVERCNPADCPLFPLRKMNYQQRLLWFAALNRADLEYMTAYHYVCMGVKLDTRQLPAVRRQTATPTTAG
jgi:hypothetical protein